MGEFHEIWIEQCEAARDIREAFGLESRTFAARSRVVPYR
jgi:hypothetical protein